MHEITPDALTAHHEASHATIAWCVGYSPLSITMCDPQTGRGRARFAEPRRRRAIEQATKIIPDIEVMLGVVVRLAGIEAEARLDPEMCCRKYHDMLASGRVPNDHLSIRRMLSPENGYTQRDVDVLMPVLLFVTRSLVESHWAQIEALAGALLEHGIVERKQMVSILGRRTTRPRDLICMLGWLILGARLAAANP